MRCATAVQAGIAERNTVVPNDERIQFRIGINLGDVIVEGDDLYGDGVNIAARIEALADVVELSVDLAAHLAKGVFRDTNAAGLGDALEPCGDIDAVADDVVALDDHVTKINADAPFDATVFPDTHVPLGHRLLHVDRATHCIDDAWKLHQQAIAGGLDDATIVLGDLRIDELSAQRFEAFERAFLIRAHQSRIARDIGGQNRGEAAGLAHVVSPAASRRPDRNSSRCSGRRSGFAVGTITGVSATSRSRMDRASSKRPVCA